VAPGSQILPVRVLDPDGRGDTFFVAYAIEWAINQGADVINLSLGTQENSRLFHDVMLWAVEQGVSVVAAAGNSNTSVLHYPAAYPAVVAVTAVGETKTKAPFANYGSWIDVAAPGVGITSTIVTAQGSGYATWSGTSMATPFVSGAIALLRQKFPEKQVRELHQRLQTRSEVIDEQNIPYPGLLGTFLHVEAAMAEDVVSPFKFALYIPLIITIDPRSVGEDPLYLVQRGGSKAIGQ
jgi:subtilisin family serine protease